MALDFDLQDPGTQKTIAAFLVPIVLLYAFYHFMVQPKVNELEMKTQEVTTLRHRIEVTQNGLRRPSEIEGEIIELQEKYDELETLLPEQENVADLLNQLSAVEHDSKVYLVGFNATETVDGNGRPYRANKYKVVIESGFHQFAEFMSQIISLPRIMSFSDLRITMNYDAAMQEENEGLADQPRHLRVECVLTSYVFNTPGSE